MKENVGFHATELLRRLARDYHHARQEHERTAARSASRRGMHTEVRRIADRFERLLAHWVRDDALREAWQRHLYEGAPAPDGPRLARPARFKGRTAAGAIVEIRDAPDGGHDVFVDGARAVHHAVPWHVDPDRLEPVLVGEHRCTEQFDAPAMAVRALRAFVDGDALDPPWDWARELVEDGLVDADFALTPRGLRCLRAPAPARATAPARSRFCVLAASAARARILTLESVNGELEPTLEPLREVADLTHPERRARDAELLSDGRPGLRRESAHGPRHAVSDRRDHHRRNSLRRFAELVVDEAARVWRRYPTCTVVVVAGPEMISVLRPAIARRNRGASAYDVRELTRDLSRLAPPALHDALSELALLPPRARLPVSASRRPSVA